MSSTFEQKPGDGVVFANESENPNAPAMKGNATLPLEIKPGQKVQVAMWRKTSKTGKDYYTIRIEPLAEK